jgi:hypothetical protein
MNVKSLGVIFLILILIGCGGQEPRKASSQSAARNVTFDATTTPGPLSAGESETQFISQKAAVGRGGAKENGNPVAAAGQDLPPERKIIFTGTLDVEVKEFGEARKQLDALVGQAKAYYSKTEILGDSGKKRSGLFVIKVPVEQFQSLVNDITLLGNPIKNHTDSQDVTEEFVDTTARVKNLKAEEEVLNKLLKEAGSRLEDVFKIREHIRNNRLEIERNEARVQALGKMAALSSLTVTLREIEAYIAPVVPKPTEPVVPAFAERADSTWNESYANLKSLTQVVALAGVAVAPWLPIAVVAGLGIWGVRRYHGSRTVAT